MLPKSSRFLEVSIAVECNQAIVCLGPMLFLTPDKKVVIACFCLFKTKFVLALGCLSLLDKDVYSAS